MDLGYTSELVKIDDAISAAKKKGWCVIQDPYFEFLNRCILSNGRATITVSTIPHFWWAFGRSISPYDKDNTSLEDFYSYINKEQKWI